MTYHLTLEEALAIASGTLGGPPDLRDVGLLEAALARPRTSVFGEDAYPTLHQKAAALLQSIVLNHPLIDGNKRLGFAATAVFLDINGAPLTLDDESQAYDLVIDVVTGELSSVEDIAEAIEHPR